MKNQLKVISETYLTSYVIDGKLGKGGQGVTFLLKEKPDFVRFSVLKILNFDRPKTRKRFHIERTALETLNSENLNIPSLLESNSDEYNNKEIPLYIRLSYIKGNTLDDFINTNGTLSLIEAVEIGIQLLEILVGIHELNIVHRDIKPKNIIINDLKELYLVDFGLSFHEIYDESITNTDDTIGNSFYSLPEHRLKGEDKRDERSDISMAIGIIYYLMTNCNPIENYDSDGNKPHQRKCFTDIKIEPSIQLLKLNGLFDLSFENNKLNRIQTAEEALKELINIMEEKSTKKDLKSIAKVASEKLSKNSFSIKASATAKKHIDELNLFFVKEMQSINSQIEPFKLERGGGHITRFIFMNREGQIDKMSFNFGLVHQDYRQEVRGIEYKFCLDGNTCILYRREGKVFINKLNTYQNRPVKNIEEDEILRFNFEDQLQYEIISHDLNNIVAKSIDRLTNELNN